METAISLAVIIVSVVLILVVLLQANYSSFNSAFGGGSGSINRTRRGVEKTLFQFTIGTAVVFIVLTILASLVG